MKLVRSSDSEHTVEFKLWFYDQILSDWYYNPWNYGPLYITKSFYHSSRVIADCYIINRLNREATETLLSIEFASTSLSHDLRDFTSVAPTDGNHNTLELHTY